MQKKYLLPKITNQILLKKAFTHRSFYRNNLDICDDSNEKLEFLGDSVLNLSVAHFLYSKYNHLPEGQLSKARSVLVSEQFLHKKALALSLDKKILLSDNAKKLGLDQNARLLVSVFESICAVYFLESGLEHLEQWLSTLFKEDLLNIDYLLELDYKTKLQEDIQAVFKKTPMYEVTEKEKIFYAKVLIDGIILGKGSGKNKKIAEQEAAKKALIKNKSQGFCG